MIKKIRTTKAKASLRYKGIGLTTTEKAMVLKINEMVEQLNTITKQIKKLK